ncbi:hypothetical protein ES705_02208 [subsurface metagenome]|nr:hypothetical protein [Clostridia bacterium]
MQRNDKTKLGLILNNRVYPLRIPLSLSKDETLKHYPLFDGITAGLSEISCHASALSFGYSPHTPHSHKGEELLMLLSGNLNLVLANKFSPDKIKSIPIEKGQFVYYSSYFTHTHQATSEEHANYLTFHWYTGLKNTASVPTLGCFNMFDRVEHSDVKNGFYSQVLFEGPTGYLKKLHCHISILMPGSGYKPHSDTYDVAIIVLEGEIETIGQKAKPYDVIFYSARKPHGICNPGTTLARYIVFEFHSNKKMLIGKIFNIFAYFFTRVSERGRLKRKLKKILNLLHTKLKLF